VTGLRSRRARRSNPPVSYGFRRGGRHPDLPDGVTLRGEASEVGLGWCEETRGSPDLTSSRAGDTGARGATRRARAISSKNARFAFSRALRPMTCPVHASGTRRRKPSRAGRGSQAPGAATHRGSQRNRHRLVPASSGAKASLAREERTLVGCARALFQLQKSASDAEAQRSATPVGNGAAWTGAWLVRNPKGSVRVKRRRHPPSRWPNREDGENRSRALERALRGEGS